MAAGGRVGGGGLGAAVTTKESFGSNLDTWYYGSMSIFQSCFCHWSLRTVNIVANHITIFIWEGPDYVFL